MHQRIVYAFVTHNTRREAADQAAISPQAMGYALFYKVDHAEANKYEIHAHFYKLQNSSHYRHLKTKTYHQ